MNELINDKGVYRTAPATPGLLNTRRGAKYCIPSGSVETIVTVVTSVGTVVKTYR